MSVPPQQRFVQDKVFVGLEQVPETLEKLQGSDGAFLSHIAMQGGGPRPTSGGGAHFGGRAQVHSGMR